MSDIGVLLVQAGCLLKAEDRHLQNDFDTMVEHVEHYTRLQKEQLPYDQAVMPPSAALRLTHDYCLAAERLLIALLNDLRAKRLHAFGRCGSLDAEPTLLRQHFIPYVKCKGVQAFRRSELIVGDTIWYDFRLLRSAERDTTQHTVDQTPAIMTRLEPQREKSTEDTQGLVPVSRSVGMISEGSELRAGHNTLVASAGDVPHAVDNRARKSFPSESVVIDILLGQEDISDLKKSDISKIAREIRPILTQSRFDGEFWHELKATAKERGIPLRRRGRPSIK